MSIELSDPMKVQAAVQRAEKSVVALAATDAAKIFLDLLSALELQYLVDLRTVELSDLAHRQATLKQVTALANLVRGVPHASARV